MRKFILFIFLVILGIFYNAPSFAETKPGVLVIWIPEKKPQTGIRQIGKKFEEDTGVKVIVENFPLVEIQFSNKATKGNGPDMIMWAHDRFGEWAENRLLEPLEISDSFRQKFFDFSWDALKYKGKYYGYPVAVEAIGLACNKDIMPQVPKNFEDFKNIGDKYKAEGKNLYPILFSYNEAYYSFPLMAANGGYVFKRTNDGYNVKDTGINNEGSRIGLGYIKDMITEGFLPKGADFNLMENAFKHGRAACILTGPWTLNTYDELGMNISFNLLPKLNGKPVKPFVGILSFGVNAYSSNKEHAKNFVENYLLTDEGLKIVNNDLNLGAVALKSYQKIMEKDKKTGHRVSVTIRNAKNGEIMPNIPEMSKFWAAIYTAIRNVVYGKQSVEDALKTAESKVVN